MSFVIYFIGNRDIQSLKVKCENEEDSCEWVGELRSLEDHLNTCGYVRISCPNRCQKRSIFAFLANSKKDMILRKDLQKHLKEECPRRQYNCPHCEKTGEYEDITGHHIQTCPKMIIECPNAPQCTVTLPRENTYKHVCSCQYETVSCKYKPFGCTAKPLRKDLQAHESDDKIHLHSTMDTVLRLTNEISLLRSQLTTNTKSPAISHAFKVTSFSQKKSNNIVFHCTPFFTHPQGYKMVITINANGIEKNKGSHISLWVYLMKGEYDDELEFPFKGTVIFELLNQLEDKCHHKISLTYDGTEKSSKRVMVQERSTDGRGLCAFIPHSELGHSAAKNCRQYTCPHCNEIGKYSQITGPHLKVCPKVKISCPNDQCEAIFLQEDKKNHLSMCQYNRVSCKYKEFGCEFMALQKDIHDHEKDDTAHLHITMDTVLTLKKQCVQLKNENIKLQKQIQLTTGILNLNPDYSTLRLSFKMPEFAAKKEKNIVLMLNAKKLFCEKMSRIISLYALIKKLLVSTRTLDVK